MTIKMIPLAEIGYDKKYYPRVNGEPDWYTKNQYANALAADPKYEFPPVHVVKVTGKEYKYMLLDGKHRCGAYDAADRELIPASIETITQSKWFARSVELNAAHGRRLDTGDKAWICIRLQEEGYTIEAAAKLLHMTTDALEKIKATRAVKLKAGSPKTEENRSDRQIDNGDRFGFLKAPFTDAATVPDRRKALAIQDSVASSSVVNILHQCIAVLEVGVDESMEDVREAMERLRGLIKA